MPLLLTTAHLLQEHGILRFELLHCPAIQVVLNHMPLQQVSDFLIETEMQCKQVIFPWNNVNMISRYDL